jgi:hypothetical protein
MTDLHDLGLRTVTLPRVMTAKQATELVGADVPDLQPTVTEAVRAVDADTGETVFAYAPLGDVAELRRAVLAIHVSTHYRMSGLTAGSRTFGYSQRRPVYQREGCSMSALGQEQPAEHRVLEKYADRLADMLQVVDPGLVERGRVAVAEVEDDWRLGDRKLWTSGVVNQSAVLPYHRDAFNFPAWSAMPVLRRHVEGGYLHIPEYGATIGCRDGWAVFFAGYQLVHGVTPMGARRDGGYRYSVVFYALKGMKDCFTAAEETRYSRKRRTEREQEMARQLAAGEQPDIRDYKELGSVTQGQRGHVTEDGRTLALRPGRGPSGRQIGGRAQRDFTEAEPMSDRRGTPSARHNMKAGKGGAGRIVGGRDQVDFGAAAEPGPAQPPAKRQPGRDPRIKGKTSGRLIGGRSGAELPGAKAAPKPRRRRRDITGDPTAIEDAYRDALDAQDGAPPAPPST